MEDKRYPIVMWDAVIARCSNYPKPLVYFLPDLELLDYIKRNDWRIRIKIIQSGAQYDDKIIWATVNIAAYEAGCRPNFFDATELYTLTLESLWNGYPPSLGHFIIVKGLVNQQQLSSLTSLPIV